MPKTNATFAAGDNVFVSALVVSIDERKKQARISIGWGSSRTIHTVPLTLLSKPLPKALVEAASWAVEMSEGGTRQ